MEHGKSATPHSAATRDELLHELQVHQIELEMQNETLRQTQLELEASLDRYRDLYDFAPVGYLTVNQEGLITRINHTGAAMFGLEKKRLIHRPVSHYFVGDYGACLLFNLQSDAASCYCEQCIELPNGERIHVDLRCQRTESGLSVTITDTTLQYQAQTRLLESEQKFRAIFEATLDGIALVDDAGFIVNCNAEFMRQTGRTLEALRSIRIWELRPDDKAGSAREKFHDLLATGDRGVVILRYKKPDSCVISVEFRSLAVDISGRRYLQCISRDITERLHSELLLRESEQKLRAIFDNALDGIVLTRIKDRTFYSANPAFCNMLGYDEVAGLSVADIHLPEDLVWISADIAKHARGEKTVSQDIPVVRRDGSMFYADIKSSPVTLDDQHYLLAIFRDVSERKRAEKELIGYQQLLRDLAQQRSLTREAERRHIAREIHDELGQLLTALRMDISLLRIQFAERDPSLMMRVQDMLALVDKSIKGVRNISTRLHPPALDMGIVAAIEWLKDDFSERSGIDCRLQVVDEPSGLSQAQILTLFRIVQESLTNIARHAEAGEIAIKIEPCCENICVEVKDDGKGFDTESVSVKKSFGLFGMKERALAVNGQVRIDSAPGEGTVVSVRIPLFDTKLGRRSDD